MTACYPRCTVIKIRGKTVPSWRDLLVGVGHGGDGLRDGRVHGVEARVDGEARGRGGC